jgi:hypothetical protein
MEINMRDDSHLDDNDTVIEDGESVTVPIHLMDSVQRRFAADNQRPHYGQMSDEIRELRARTRET